MERGLKSLLTGAKHTAMSTQSGQAGSQSQNVNISRLQTIKFVKYILNNSANKIPIKKSDITTALDFNPRHFAGYLQEVQAILEDVYGFKLVQVPQKNPAQYICISSIEPVGELEYSAVHRRHMLLIFLVLSFIFMSSGSVSEEVLRQYLHQLGILWDEPHEHFGNVKKLLTETYVKQQYLQREKRVLEGVHEEEIFYTWGFRSVLEFPKQKVLELVAKIMDRPTMCFPQQHQEVYGEEPVAMEVESNDI